MLAEMTVLTYGCMLLCVCVWVWECARVHFSIYNFKVKTLCCEIYTLQLYYSFLSLPPSGQYNIRLFLSPMIHMTDLSWMFGTRKDSVSVLFQLWLIFFSNFRHSFELLLEYVFAHQSTDSRISVILWHFCSMIYFVIIWLDLH